MLSILKNHIKVSSLEFLYIKTTTNSETNEMHENNEIGVTKGLPLRNSEKHVIGESLMKNSVMNEKCVIAH